jgi:hypothetical protein
MSLHPLRTVQNLPEKMTMKSRHILAALTAGVAVLAVNYASAEVVQTINIQVTALTQGPEVTKGNTVSAGIVKTRITTKDLLNILTTNAPKTKLVIVGDDGLQVWQGKSTTPLVVLTEEQLSHSDGEIEVEKAKWNNQTHAASGNGFSLNTVTINVGDHHIQITGLGDWKYSASAVKNEEQKVNESYTLTGAGEGSTGGEPALFTGKVTAKGSGTVPVEPDDEEPPIE